MRVSIFVGGLVLAAAAGSLRAQVRPGPGAARLDSMPSRAQMEQRMGERLGEMMKKQLGLTEQQVPKLQETNRRFQEKHRLLVEQERDIRMSLRDEMIAGDSGRQTQVGGLLDRMLKVQRQRLELVEQEQKDLSAFLTPVQRAKYLGVQEGMRRRMEQMRQNGGGPAMGPMRNRMGPGGPGEGMRPMGPTGAGRGNPMRPTRRPMGPGVPPPDSLFS